MAVATFTSVKLRPIRRGRHDPKVKRIKTEADRKLAFHPAGHLRDVARAAIGQPCGRRICR